MKRQRRAMLRSVILVGHATDSTGQEAFQAVCILTAHESESFALLTCYESNSERRSTQMWSEVMEYKVMV